MSENAIEVVSKYIPYLDQVYSHGSRSSVLDAPNELVKATADAKTVLIAKTSMPGLANYNRNGAVGFESGNVSLTWESHTLEKDRGRSFQIDAMDDVETLGVAFGKLSSEFIRTKVVPEVDAIRFATYAQAAENGTGEASAKYSPNHGSLSIDESPTGEPSVSTAIDTAIAEMKDNGVDLSRAFLFINPIVNNMLKNSKKFVRNLTPGQNPNSNFGKYDELTIVEVPSTRFYTDVALAESADSMEGDGGYNLNGSRINFMIVDPAAVLQITKHAKMRVFSPDVNQSADAYKVDYRIYHDAWVLENKLAGIYCHHE